MPAHHSYLEPYAGGIAVLRNKEPSRIETINDLDEEIINLFLVIQDYSKRGINTADHLYTVCQIGYDSAYPDDPEEFTDVERAKNLLIRSGMG